MCNFRNYNNESKVSGLLSFEILFLRITIFCLIFLLLASVIGRVSHSIFTIQTLQTAIANNPHSISKEAVEILVALAKQVKIGSEMDCTGSTA